MGLLDLEGLLGGSSLEGFLLSKELEVEDLSCTELRLDSKRAEGGLLGISLPLYPEMIWNSSESSNLSKEFNVSKNTLNLLSSSTADSVCAKVW